MKLKILILVFLFVSAFGTPLSTKAETLINHRFFQELSRALYEKDTTKLNSFLEPSVKIPEIIEKKIHRLVGLLVIF
jgi:hypothetical protein